MPEKQNVMAARWHRQFNSYLQSMLHWHQLGDSNIDLPDPTRPKYRDRGIDSIFAYKRNPNSYQQIVIVEAKTVDQVDNLSQQKIQDWITDLQSKVENIPHTETFRDRFQPEIDAKYHMGLIGLWVRDVKSYDHERIKKWLSQVQVARRKVPIYIGFVENQALTRWSAIHREVTRIQNSENCKEINFWFPDYGEKPTPDGTSIPIEALFSKFAFCKASMIETTKSHSKVPYRANFAFYLGPVRGYDDFHFIGLALKQFQLLDANELVIYTLSDEVEIRDYAEILRRTLQPVTPEGSFKFRQLVPNLHLQLEGRT